MNAATPELSVVVPFYNEEECAALVIGEVRAALDALGRAYEVVAVDDGSSDGTFRALQSIAREDPRIRILRWHPNRGQGAALYDGLRHARGSILVTLDGDGQNDPADIPSLLAALDDADMVVGVRAQRRDSWLRRRMSRIANTVRGRILRDHMRDSGCALKVFRREVTESLIPIKTLYSFIPALAVAAGFRVAQRDVRHRPRHGGRSSYGLRVMLWRPLLDLLGVWWFTRRRFAPLSPGSAAPEGDRATAGDRVAIASAKKLDSPDLAGGSLRLGSVATDGVGVHPLQNR
jgi:glycosyltransferase involved in cell wall biosynthesis